jgi:chromate transporter
MNAAAVGLAEIMIVVAVSTVFSLGGGNGALAVIQDRWVAGGLLESSLFAWAIALGYLSPGPRAGFLSGVGYYMHGLPGALAAMIGIIVPTCVGAAAVTYGYKKLESVIKRVSLPASFVIAGMIAATAWELASPMKLGGLEMAAIAGIAILVAWRNPEPVIIVLGSAASGLLWWFFS